MSLLALATVAFLLNAESPKPDAAEAELIALAEKLGGKAQLAKALDEQARVEVVLEAATDADLARLVKHPNLGSLELREAGKLTAKGYALLNELPDLQKLQLAGEAIGPKEAAAIGELKTLDTLYLGSCKITSAEIVAFKKLKNLKRLDLLDTAVTDTALDAILEFKKLEELNLSGTKVSEACLKKLIQLESLKILQLNNTKVSDNAIAAVEDELKAAKRILKIQR